MHIDFQDHTDSVTEDMLDLIKRLLHFTAKYENIADTAELSVSFVDNEEIRVINRDYRHKDQPTDVISFALQEESEEEMKIIGENLPLILGDILISVDRAKEQAVEYQHSLEREMGFLAVHGLLHLLGYDHMTPEDEKIMFQKQDDILGEFKLER
ncbi:rRNA maturation RNase YbeY [Virgibacillus halophilus]|uniref:rRNA maturation RNase YbeY n=1 Tax=Tigheibacillus halophilus TaxID=361280 RepID=UPI0036262271